MVDYFSEDPKKPFLEVNVYANKSSMVLDWLLRFGKEKRSFSLREVSREAKVSLGLAQKVFRTLVVRGILVIEGIRTTKSYSLKKPALLLSQWLEDYNIVRKCRMWTYSSGLDDKQEMFRVLQKSTLRKKTALSLHSAAEALGCKNTNLQGLELYMLQPEIRQEIENVLLLEPKERGYEVLLVEPYYKIWLQASTISFEEVQVSPPLLAFLDLYHFPLRGREQAEFMAERLPELKGIYRKKKHG